MPSKVLANPTCQHATHSDSKRPDYSPQALEIAAAMCKALSDPARLRILLWLVDGERCVSELVELEAEKLSTISARLQLLYIARLVSRRRETKHVYYALADQHVRDLLDNVLQHAVEPSA
jgi:DNA-binding transcriptional ArsR family regulator